MSPFKLRLIFLAAYKHLNILEVKLLGFAAVGGIR